MKIVYVTRYFWPNRAAVAAATGTLERAKRLAKRGHEVRLFAPDSMDRHMTVKRPAPTIPKGLRVSYSRPRLSRLPGDTLSFVFVGFKALRAACGAHVILGQHHYSHIGSFCAAMLSIIARRPLVIEVRDVFFRPTNAVESALGFVMKWPTRLSFRRAKQILVPGEELVDMVQRVYGLRTGKVRTLLNGVDTTRFSPRHRSDDLRRKIGSRHVVVFSGEIMNLTYSGLDVLVKATRLLRDKIPDLKVLVIGDGHDLPRLIQLANSERLNDTLQFLGWLSPELIPVYLASADVAIGRLRASIGTIGSTPLKVVEYMASGCVVVVSRGGCSEKLVMDGLNGIVIESGSVADSAKSIMRVFSDEEFATRLRSKARETAEKVYDWEVVVSELEKMLRSTAEAKA